MFTPYCFECKYKNDSNCYGTIEKCPPLSQIPYIKFNKRTLTSEEEKKIVNGMEIMSDIYSLLEGNHWAHLIVNGKEITTISQANIEYMWSYLEEIQYYRIRKRAKNER